MNSQKNSRIYTFNFFCFLCYSCEYDTVGLDHDYEQPEEINVSEQEGVRGHATQFWKWFKTPFHFYLPGSLKLDRSKNNFTFTNIQCFKNMIPWKNNFRVKKFKKFKSKSFMFNRQLYTQYNTALPLIVWITLTAFESVKFLKAKSKSNGNLQSIKISYFSF